MATFGELQTQVSKRLLDPNNEAVSLSDVASSINEAIAYWKFKRFWFNEVFDTATLTAQDGVIPLGAEFLVPSTEDDGFVIEYSGIRYPLTKISQPSYDSIWLQNGYGLPSAYARVGQEYLAYPLPDQAYTVRRHYLKEYQNLSSDTDTNDFTGYAPVLIRNWSLADLTAEFRQDDKMESYFRTRALKEYENLQTMSRKSNATGRILINSNLM